MTGPVADAALAVGFGRDPASFDPIPLTSPLPDRDGELARWDVSAREDGPYLLRLDVRGADGSRAVEFLPVSLERNVPVRLSSPGAAALAPAISGERVVWQSERAQDEEELGVELFARDWSSGEEWRVVSGPGDQQLGACVARSARMARYERRGEPRSVVSVGDDSCAVPRAGPPPRDPSHAAVSICRESSLVWTEGTLLAARLRGCRWRGDHL